MTRLLITLIKIYQRWLSPLKAPCCRFVPTCSAYALDALIKYGWARGGWLTLKRLLRCNPFCKGGYDPVP
ncbi:MAG: membrane protein insertion efficiency factor YidD [Quinella sp. 1Q5]|nr:membrane protein insertion efficiency factor YidD [Quinella sp. 1Q5]